MHTHALADGLRPRRSLWLSRRARWSAAIVAVLVVAVLAGAFVYRLTQRPYAFDRLTRIGAAVLPGAVEGLGARVFLDGGRAFIGSPTGGGHFRLAAVDVNDPAAPPIWTNAAIAGVESFGFARGSVIVVGVPETGGKRTITLLSASNGVPFIRFEVFKDDRWDLVGKYFVRYRATDHRLVITDVGTQKEIAALDQPDGAGSYWLTDNWSHQQVPTSITGAALDEPLLVDPHVVRTLPGGGIEVISLSSGKPDAAAPAVLGPYDPIVYPYAEQIFVAGQGRVEARDRLRPGKVQWTWRSPTPEVVPGSLAACGERRICVVGERRLTALDIRTGAVAFQLDFQFGPSWPSSRPLPVGDRIMIQNDVESVLLDGAGRVLRRWIGKSAARLDEGSYLLLSSGDVSGRYTVLGVQADNGATRELGTLDAPSETCSWSHLYLACAPAPGRFEFYRVRTPWYSGRL